MTVKEVSDAAAVVVDGVVESATSYWDLQRNTIFTNVRLVNVKRLKGPVGDEKGAYEFVVPGGRVGGKERIVTGGPRFAVGERWLLFLRTSFRIHPVIGIGCGAFRVAEDVNGQMKVLDVAGAEIVGIDAQGLVQTRGVNRINGDGLVVGGTSPGVRVVEVGAAAPVQGMTMDEFMGRVLPVIESSAPLPAAPSPAGIQSTHPRAAPLKARLPRDTNVSNAPSMRRHGDE